MVTEVMDYFVLMWEILFLIGKKRQKLETMIITLGRAISKESGWLHQGLGCSDLRPRSWPFRLG